MKTALALGTFDGLHSGHRAVLDATKAFYSVAVTFEIPPKAIITGKPQLLMLPDDRANRLKSLGINRVEMQNFCDVKFLSPKEYFEKLKEKYKPDRIVCGFNYRFGKDAKGDTTMLQELCHSEGIEFVCIPPVKQNETVISSTALRKLISEGKIEEATHQIYGGFAFVAPVLHGDARGRTLGFPTINQEYPELLAQAKFGVYISRVTVDGVEYDAITNVGLRPTFKTEKVGCETYIKDFSEDIYGKNVRTELLRFVRDEQKFDCVQQLKNAIENDVKSLDAYK